MMADQTVNVNLETLSIKDLTYWAQRTFLELQRLVESLISELKEDNYLDNLSFF